MVGRRHGSEEIADKLAQADELAAKGKNQQAISKALGISVMTYHRWRKLRAPPSAKSQDHSEPRRAAAPPATSPVADSPFLDGATRLHELETENSRLRRLVTDLLLEKIGLEEELRERSESSPRRSRRG
ncbi:helix-turn-helix domain-containing protein [Rhodoplanes sp. TEM]|uniref:Helix-turn-helix domain-containing protein n=1 Tax=Rhodoplanes tepidamans TaxID=200616 RepID=A0ABT5JBT5_RHOTP|nr:MULTISPECIES: helix-turn-helix domain-containing protein [Rhodoplanes]MDC7786724.1 helix-turn-helix domain-containing protein [Rhodoplanes tepidamans]MDC7983730.1 helix-turn-helix domain-containing protein [Rhodoplanes sp. TEM]MDQ0358160.1 transcriptional regulator with XRE-family HTH domain [Rhodoplanes tepidamans]